MKLKLMLAAAAAAVTLTATPASAQWFGRDRDRGGDIVVRHDAGTFRFDRGDGEYRRLIRMGFRPGYSYAYTHECNAYGCDVLVFEPGRGRAVDRFHAPYFRNAFAGNRVPGNRNYGDNDRRDRWRG
jgi:hypothetical protein